MTERFSIDEHSYYGLLDLVRFAAEQGLQSKRDIEKQGALYLLGELLDGPIELAYGPHGKPYLPGRNEHISISHSHDRLAITVNTREATGIDIELIRDKVHRIRHKFLRASELEDADDHTEKLLVYWAAKETLYKIIGQREVEFIAHLHIEPFTYQESGEINGEVQLEHFQQRFLLAYQRKEEYILVYLLNSY